MTTMLLTGGQMDEEEAAAALSVVTCLLEEEAAALLALPSEASADRWHDTAKLIAQGLIPTRLPSAPRWSSIERLRRASRGGGGIVGQ